MKLALGMVVYSQKIFHCLMRFLLLTKTSDE